MNRYQITAGAIVTRTLLASLGGYVLALSFATGSTVVLTRAFGMLRGEAFVLSAMLALLVWMLAVLVAYAAATSWRAVAWILGSALLLAGLRWWLGPLTTAGGA